MRQSIILTALFGALALSKPLASPDYQTTEVVKVVEVVDDGSDDSPDSGDDSQPDPQPAPAPQPQPQPNYVVKTVPAPAPAPKPVVKAVQAPQPQYKAPAPAPQYKAPSGGSSGDSSGGPAPGSFQDQCLKAHNDARSEHGSPPLKWNDQLASDAQNLATSCNWGHNVPDGQGQNIGAGIQDAFEQIRKQWIDDEIGKYPGGNSMDGFEGWGHYTQCVWKGTLEVGCHVANCPGMTADGAQTGPYYFVCNYKEPGNMAGEYTSNVG